MQRVVLQTYKIINLTYENKSRDSSNAYNIASDQLKNYRGNNGAYSDDIQQRQTEFSQNYYNEINSINNQKNTTVSVFWAIYSILLIMVGFMLKTKFLRTIGLVFFIITALKIFIYVWSLGTQYRVISLIVFGVIALLGSFGYAKYKDKLIS